MEIDLRKREPVVCPDCGQQLFATMSKEEPGKATFAGCRCDRQVYEVPKGLNTLRSLKTRRCISMVRRNSKYGNKDARSERAGQKDSGPSRKTISIVIVAFALKACGRALAPDSRFVETKSIHRAVVVHPEQWPAGEYRNCYLGTNDVVHENHLPTLDCDRQAHETPRSRMFAMDVEFSGDYKFPTTNDSEKEWTCQRSKESLVCRR
jgi:hypothetical protein